MLGQFANIFNFSSWDFFLLVFLVVVTLGYTFLFVVRGKILPLLVSTSLSFFLLKYVPFAVFQAFPSQLVAFVVVLLVMVFILSRVIFQSPVGSETFGIFPSLVLALTQTGFLLAVAASFFPPEIVREFGELGQRVFVGDQAIFYWALVSVVLLLLIGRKANLEVG